MKLQDVRTRDDFVKWIIENVKDVPNPVEQADWFIAVANARMIFYSYSVKDLASDLLGGIEGINEAPRTSHVDFWATLWEDVDVDSPEGVNDVMKNLNELVEHHFGSSLWQNKLTLK